MLVTGIFMIYTQCVLYVIMISAGMKKNATTLHGEYPNKACEQGSEYRFWADDDLIMEEENLFSISMIWW